MAGRSFIRLAGEGGGGYAPDYEITRCVCVCVCVYVCVCLCVCVCE